MNPDGLIALWTRVGETEQRGRVATEFVGGSITPSGFAQFVDAPVATQAAVRALNPTWATPSCAVAAMAGSRSGRTSCS